MENFTPVASLVGGMLVGLAAAAMLVFSGRIAGISGIAGGLLRVQRGDLSWRVLFVLGLFIGGFGFSIAQPTAFAFLVERSTLALVAAGLLVGVGTQLGQGCTSGHGICGLSRLSRRSFVAVGTFMFTAGLTVFAVGHLFQGAL